MNEDDVVRELLGEEALFLKKRLQAMEEFVVRELKEGLQSPDTNIRSTSMTCLQYLVARLMCIGWTHTMTNTTPSLAKYAMHIYVNHTNTIIKKKIEKAGLTDVLHGVMAGIQVMEMDNVLDTLSDVLEEKDA